MTIRLGDNQYGKAETHLVHIKHEGEVHHITDFNVSISLIGDFESSHLSGDNSRVVPTDTQKNTVFAFARQQPPGQPEAFGLRLARHFARDFDSVARARVHIEQYSWNRADADDKPHPHSFVRRGSETRLATVTCTKDADWVVAGLTDLVLLKSTGSEFHGFPRDRYTTLQETNDRILATSLTARWRYTNAESADWLSSYNAAKNALVEVFALKHSLALQQTLYAMGEGVLKDLGPEVAEVRLSMPNKHHFLVDLTPFGLDNPNEVYYAADRPYGLIEGTVIRDDAPEAGFAW